LLLKDIQAGTRRASLGGPGGEFCIAQLYHLGFDLSPWVKEGSKKMNRLIFSL
jgi:hypothetical protein